MINGLQGIPGSGKSYEATVYHVLSAVKRGRKVITNLPLNVEQFSAIDPAYTDLIELRYRPAKILGTWDANRVDDKGNGQAFLIDPTITEPVSGTKAVFGNVWDYYSDWKHPDTGQGPLFVIDECHVPMPRMGTSADVVEWYKLHRHFNQDVLVMTQNFRHMCADIADLLAMLIKVRKADILGNKDAYIRKVHGGYRGAVISEETRPYKTEFFQLYKSHTQGNSVSESSADDVSPYIVKFRRYTRAVFALGLVCCLFVGYRIATKDDPKTTVTITKNTPAQNAEYAATVGVDLPPTPSPAPGQLALPAQSDDAIPEPYETQTLHMTGRIRMGTRETYTFTVAQNGLVVNHITDTDLRKAGYQFLGTTDCTGVLTWRNVARAVSCNYPSQQMAVDGVQKKG